MRVTQAEARLAAVRTDFANLKTNLASTQSASRSARETVDLKQRDVERKNTLLANRTGSQMDMDNALTAVVAAKTQLETLEQQQQGIRNQLLGDHGPADREIPRLTAQASAALDQAKRDLDHTVLRAPIAGIATQVSSIQLGRYVTAGTPVFSLIDDANPWIDANPKETDITHLRVGPAGRDFGRHVSGPQIPRHGRGRQPRHRRAVRDPAAAERERKLGQGGAARSRPHRRSTTIEDVRDLRAGMSVTVDIDTGRQNTVLSLARPVPARPRSSQK